MTVAGLTNTIAVSIISKPAVQSRMNQNIRVACVAPGPRGPFSALRMVRNPFASIGADWKRYGDVIARSEPRTRTRLLLEAIALRHQIAVLERSRTRRP